jgi:hypothetical protein
VCRALQKKVLKMKDQGMVGKRIFQRLIRQTIALRVKPMTSGLYDGVW